jgi:glycosyltransferase involved in cell wall biosynthesis
MIIGIDGHMLGDHSGGNESYYRNILREMVVSSDDIVYLFVRDTIEADEYKDKFRVIKFRSKSAFLRNFYELDLLCKKYQVEVLHTQYFIPFIRHCKVVCTIHDICFEHYKDIFIKKEYLRQKILIPYAAKHSDYIFTVSEYSKNDIVKQYRIKPEKVIVTYNAVNQRFHTLDKNDLNEEELRGKFGIGKAKYILTVGNLQPRKNIPRLIEAFNLWNKQNNHDVKLVIVGKKAWLYSDVIKAVNKKPESIVLTDYVSDEDLIRLYNGAECFIYPSFFEGFGIPPLEAMACGIPVAVANTTSLPEVVGNAGLYFDPFMISSIADAIDRLMNYKDRNEMIKKGFNQVGKFHWNDSAGLIVDTYHRTVR